MVEWVDSNPHSTRSRRDTASPSLPCNTHHEDLLDYFTAINNDALCYVAAERHRFDRPEDFVIGMAFSGVTTLR